MVPKELTRRRKAAGYAALLANMRRPHDLAKITLLLLVWAHVRSRPGYATHDTPQPLLRGRKRKFTPKKKGYTVKRPRSRFL